jgi:hypothetical protein
LLLSLVDCCAEINSLNNKTTKEKPNLNFIYLIYYDCSTKRIVLLIDA